MKQLMILAAMVVLAVPAMADIFGTGDNAFTIDFVPISKATNPTSGIPAGDGFTFTGVSNDYRMGKYEITNDQWAKFKVAYGTVTGSPLFAYGDNSYFTGMNLPVNNVSWYEAVQFVNFLNISTGHQMAYKFTGTQGTSDYTFELWQLGDVGYNPLNPYRNSNAFYFLPTENEWGKAAYWNGSYLQTWANVGNLSPTQSGWNYYDNGYATNPYGPWNTGSGSQELNGTFDMMGNVWEWMESSYYTGYYLPNTLHGVRGGSYSNIDHGLGSSFRLYNNPNTGSSNVGFRVASIPEPCTLLLLVLGGIMARKR